MLSHRAFTVSIYVVYIVILTSYIHLEVLSVISTLSTTMELSATLFCAILVFFNVCVYNYIGIDIY